MFSYDFSPTEYLISIKGSPVNIDAITDNAITSLINTLRLKPIEKITKRFTPYGTTLVHILKESHITVHTYPEHKQVFIDLFLCSTELLSSEIKILRNLLRGFYKTDNIKLKILIRD